MVDRRDLYDELKERNSVAQSARRKTGGKKKYLLPSDRLSASQIKKMNGAITVYEMKKPISWSKFKSYPRDIQKEYLQWFVDEFDASSGLMASVFGMNAPYICTLFRKMGFSDIMRRQPTRDGINRFNVWLQQFKDGKAQETEPQKPSAEKKEKIVIPPFFNTITSGEILLEGKATEIGQTLFNMFQNETITMCVKFEVVKRKEEPEDAKVV